MVVSANRLELLQIADAVAREKSIDKSIVIAAMADAIQKAARSRYGQETNIRADINPNTGEMKLQRLMEVVETVEDYATQIALSSARERNPDAQVGCTLTCSFCHTGTQRLVRNLEAQEIVGQIMLARDRIGDLQEFKPVGAYNHFYSPEPCAGPCRPACSFTVQVHCRFRRLEPRPTRPDASWRPCAHDCPSTRRRE